MMFAEYPKALYRNADELVVSDLDGEAAARADGFRFWSDPVTGPQEVSHPPVLFAPGVPGDLSDEPAKRGPGRPKKVQP